MECPPDDLTVNHKRLGRAMQMLQLVAFFFAAVFFSFSFSVVGGARGGEE
jgi:hypothetical protein